MNGATFERFGQLADIDVGDREHTNISIVDCAVVSTLPHRIEMLERPPKASQAFIQLDQQPVDVVDAPDDDQPNLSALRAFRSDGHQGFNMRRGIWHMPLIGFQPGQSFLIIDRVDPDNCDEFALPSPILLREAQ